METLNFIAHENRPYWMVQDDLRKQKFFVEKRLPETEQENGWVKMEYYAYMKSVTDAWVRMLNVEEDKCFLMYDNYVAITAYKGREYLDEYDKNLKSIYTREERPRSIDESYFNELYKEKQKIADQFLSENTFSYDDWFEKIYKTKIAR